MKSFFILRFCLAFLLTIIHESGGSEEKSVEEWLIELTAKLDEMAESGEKINDILKLTTNGYLGKGGFGLAYQGVRASDSKPVAIKFIQSEMDASAEREYTIYTYLDAINNEKVERFGVPAIYYYGHWDDYIVMALSLLEDSLNTKANEGELGKPLNNLIVFREFVRQSKYLHSRGVRHDDIKSDNIMIRNYQSFLIDYNLSSEIEEDTYICTFLFKPRRCHRHRIRFAIDDWENFFYAMCHANDIPLKWLFTDKYNHPIEKIFNRRLAKAKKDIADIRSKVEAIESEPVRACFMAFYKVIFGKRVKKFPNYDEMYRIITEQIEELVPSNDPVFFTWLNESDTTAALEHMKEHPVPDIQNDIKEPSHIKFDTFIYPKVNFEYFHEKNQLN